MKKNLLVFVTLLIACSSWSFASDKTNLDGAVQTAVENDECDQATVVGALPFTDNVTASQATADGSDPELSCGSGGGGRTVWYTFTAVSTAYVSINTFGSNYDTVLGLFTGSCGSLSEMACNDDAQATQSEIVFEAQVGQSYIIHVAEWNGDHGAGN